MTGYVHSIENFGSVDGPGIRFIIFLAGCPLRCLFCHNPDTWKMSDGKLMSADELIQKALRYRPYWKDTGGITASGGEPLVQIDFLIELFTLAKENNVNTCIDTSGGPFRKEGKWFSKFEKLMEVTDLLLVDIKHIDEAEHIKLTRRSGKNIREMIEYLSDIDKPIWIRHVLIPGITDKDEYLYKMRDYIRTLKNVKRVDILPYHTLGEMKYKKMGIPYPLHGVEPPTKERVENAKRILEADKYSEWLKNV